ncbi:MAG: WXG100 family type VII secretion target [Actinomycetaceae bacterium]|nr:WXG100 family type VII secretion target [Actinomycetaceae bacterium]
MSLFHVDTAEVARCSGLISASANALRAEVNTMMAHITALEASWSGTASNQFTATAEQWRATQALVEQSLDDISSQLALAATTYADAEAQTSALFAPG